MVGGGGGGCGGGGGGGGWWGEGAVGGGCGVWWTKGGAQRRLGKLGMRQGMEGDREGEAGGVGVWGGGRGRVLWCVGWVWVGLCDGRRGGCLL